ncbi:MAG: hypothetical protein QW470_06935 [Candidatus Caldarchaeum sp.]|uniref:Uncharacterized protein n=1 Tax=Caldiarchaeum subterraneum TaxID=311458 RepID=A0A7C5QE65_CALS0
MTVSRADVLASLVEQLEYCERMLAMEARLDLVVVILEELIQKLSSGSPGIDEQERLRLLERARLTYHRAKTLLYLAEATKDTKY